MICWLLLPVLLTSMRLQLDELCATRRTWTQPLTADGECGFSLKIGDSNALITGYFGGMRHIVQTAAVRQWVQSIECAADVDQKPCRFVRAKHLM